MDAYHQQRRFAGSGDAPPPPQQPPHPSHPNAHWYPAAPPPYPSHPSHPYPPQHHHHWGSPHDLQQQHQRHPPPPQQQLYGYQQPPPPIAIQQQQQQPPPPPGNPWPPHHASGQPPPPNYPPPPPGQAWTNHSWAQNHGYPGQHRETNHLLDRGPLVSPAQTFGSFPSTYEQEVSYNYSSAPGNANNMLQYPNSQGQPFPTASTVQGGFLQATPSMPVVPSAEQPPFGHERQSVDPSDQPLEFNSLKAPDVVVHTNVNSTIPAAPTLASNYDVVTTSTHSWTPSTTVGFLPRAPLPPQAAQMDPHAAPLFGAASSSNYAPPATFGVGSVTEVFPTDPNTPFSVAEKSKKRPVPNWLREELLKKKSAPSNASAHPTNLNSMESHDAEQPLGIPDQSDSRSNDSAKSTEGNEDDEDEIEASRVAAINREIKRVLTEVLLKVTDDLFDEIATKVLNEDDSSAESNEPAGVGSKEHGPGEARTKTTAKVLLPAKPTNISSSDHKDSTGLSSPKGALLGLASYDSDDDDDDNDSKDKIPISDLSANACVANTEEGDKSTLGKEHMNHDGKKLSRGSTSSGEDLKSINKNSQRSTKVEPEREHIHDIQNGEFPVDAKTFIKPNSAVDKMDEKADRYAAVDVQNRKTSSNNHAEKYDDLESSHRHLEKSSKDFVKEVKTDHAKEHESFTAKKYNSDDKYSIHGNVDKKSSFKEGKGSDRTSKHESNRRDSRSNSKHDGAKADRKDFPKDTRERDRDTTDRRGGKGKDEKDDRSRQMTKGSTSHSRNSRSRSPRGRSRSRRENSSHVRGSVSSDEPSDSMKKRKHHSRKNSMSPSPPKSRNRRISRSPHSKHSHRRHSPYSSDNR
ncbi:hypothetical protein GQ55_7G317600 [Panicum hallii var. hallii]|nr:hypothetical protein GQ55_7G317600 [Panicum hallii var. hallii]